MSEIRVRTIETAIARRFPLERAESWDRVGLLAGDPDALVTGVVVALDPTRAAIREAAGRGANVLVTHHPAFLSAPERIVPGRGGAGVLFSALESGVALIGAHTNLDRDPEAAKLLPAALGLTARKPVERGLQTMSVVTVFAPESARERVVDAMIGAGAGRIGEYERCSFAAPGTGRFAAPQGGDPYVGAAGEMGRADEIRLEMVCPLGRTRGVVSAAVSAHPYEEPVVWVTEAALARNAARLGMVSDTADGAITLAALADRARAAFGSTPRVWGDRDLEITRVATATGSASSLLGEVLASGAQVLVAGEVRYHDALDAVESGLAIVELGHDVSEWPLASLLESAIRTIPGIDTVPVHVLPARPGWWTP